MQFHTPVLAEEVSRALEPTFSGQDGGVLVDATCGAGGHTLAILERSSPRTVLLFDRDPEALAQAAQVLRDAPCAVDLIHAPFSRIPEELSRRGVTSIRALIADLGVSSHQLDTPSRGFSFRDDGPLDMRMDPTTGVTAADVIASTDAPTLARILRELGEEREATRIARAVIAAQPSTTRELAAVVQATVRQHGQRIHPATRTFQALRIHVNRELDELDTLLASAPDLLVIGGRLAVVTFHSLEDRRVKRRMRELSHPTQPPASLPILADALPRPRFTVPAPYRGGLTASQTELDQNPRARSARLRVLERILD